MAMKQEGLEHYMGQQYYVILMKKNNKFYLHVPELSLIAEDERLDEAYKKLEKEKEEYFRKTIEMNMQDEIPLPAGTNIKIKKNLLSNFSPFIIKASVIFLIGFIFLNLTAAIIKFTAYEIKSIPYQIINKMNAMPDEEIERKRLLVRQALEKLKPFVEEFKAVFSENKENSK